MLGGLKGFVDAQGAALVDLTEQALHALQHAHRAGFEKDPRQFRVLIAGGHHQAMQVDRLLTVDQAMKARAMFNSTVLTGMPSGSSKYMTGNCSSHLATTAAVNSVSLSVKWL